MVAPYATALGAMIEPEAAVRNLARLSDAGASGRYGFREALDYTRRRLPEDTTVAVVNSYMAHHQGMSLVAIGNVLHDSAMVRRFHAEPMVQATELLLQERVPRDVLVSRLRSEEVKSDADVRDLVRRSSAASRPRATRYPEPTCCRTAATPSWSPPRGPDTAAGETSPCRAGARM